jgi:putative FmdB family regulatory protein
MPLYEYECEKGHRFEKIQKFSDPPLEKCPTCGSPVQKLISSPAIQFKGTGWYITDYARKDSGGGAKPDGTKDAGADAKTETKTESKSDAKTEAKKTDTKKSETAGT